MHLHISGDIGFSVFGYPIAYYGLLIAIGVLVGGALAFVQGRLHKVRFEDVLLVICICAIGAAIGAKLLYFIVSLPSIDFSRLTDPDYLLSLISGGFVFYGGLIGALAGIPISARLFKIDAWKIANVIAPCIALGHGFGRIGCLLVGCCYGMPFDGSLTVTYNHSLVAPNGIELLPVQLIEAVCEFVIAAGLFVYVNKFHGKRGLVVYIAAYSIVRFVLEFFRYDDVERGIAAGISTSQWISIALIICLLIWYFLSKRKIQENTPSQN